MALSKKPVTGMKDILPAEMQIRDYVISNTNITAEEYKANERRQWYLDAHEMKEKGLIGIIIGEGEN